MKQKDIVIQVRREDNYVSASFRVSYVNERALFETLHRILPVTLTHGSLVCENLEFPFTLNEVSFQQNRK